MRLRILDYEYADMLYFSIVPRLDLCPVDINTVDPHNIGLKHNNKRGCIKGPKITSAITFSSENLGIGKK